MVFKGHQNLPNNLSTPTVVPNLVAEFEARSSAQNDALWPHVATGPFIPPASGSRQVSKDLPSQDFPTVVPAALPSNSSSKSLKIPLPINGDISSISLDRSSAVTNQKDKLHKDLPLNSASSQQPQGYPPKTVQPARVDNGKYYQPYVSYTTQAQRVPHPEKQLEESAQNNPEWSAQTISRPEPSVTHGAKTASSSRALWPVDVLPSTTLQREVPSDQLYAALPSSRDEQSSGKIISEDASGHGAKPREIQPDPPYVVGRLAPQADVPKHVVIDARISPLTVKEHKVGHGKPSALLRLGYQFN
jgi:hypothetical protein